jgi:hypothetical protein
MDEISNSTFYFCNLSLQLLSRCSDGLRAGRPGIELRQGQEFSLLHSVQTGSGAHSLSYTMGTGDSFSEGKAAGAWSWPLTSN